MIWREMLTGASDSTRAGGAERRAMSARAETVARSRHARRAAFHAAVPTRGAAPAPIAVA